MSPATPRSARGTTIYPFASLGTPPQSVHYRGGPTRLAIGGSCDIRESVTMNTGTEEGGGVTTVGDGCFFMVGAACRRTIASSATTSIFANNAVLGGHCEIGDHVFLGGHCAVHQFTRDRRERDDRGLFGAARRRHPVRVRAARRSARLVGLNVIGMRRRGVTQGRHPRRAERPISALFEGEGEFAARIDLVEAEFGGVPEVAKIVAFLRAKGAGRSC